MTGRHLEEDLARARARILAAQARVARRALAQPRALAGGLQDLAHRRGVERAARLPRGAQQQPRVAVQVLAPRARPSAPRVAGRAGRVGGGRCLQGRLAVEDLDEDAPRQRLRLRARLRAAAAQVLVRVAQHPAELPAPSRVSAGRRAAGGRADAHS